MFPGARTHKKTHSTFMVTTILSKEVKLSRQKRIMTYYKHMRDKFEKNLDLKTRKHLIS